MLCARCGAPNPETTPFCEKCGALLEAGSGIPSAIRNQPGQSPVGSSWDALFEQKSAQTGSAEASTALPFAPVAHIPFSQDPLPQPSQPLPTLILPVDEVRTFTPPASPLEPPLPAAPENAASERRFADYPTDVRVPVTPALPQAGLPPTIYASSAVDNQPEARFMANMAPAVSQQSITPPASMADNAIAWKSGQLSPTSDEKTLSQAVGNMYHGPATSVFREAWEQDESYSPFMQTLSQPPSGTEYPGRPSGATNSPSNTWQQNESYVPFTQASPSGPSLGNVYPGLPKNPRGPVAVSGMLDTPLDQVNQFVRPLPIWASALGVLGGALLLVGLIFLNPDWATGALIAGVIAIILAILLLIASGVRVVLGMLSPTNPRRVSQVVGAGLLVLILFVFSGIGLGQQSGLHAMQARYLESKQAWQTAVTEFQDAGEMAPSSSNLARVYNEWGEYLLTGHQYAGAIAKFAMVLNTYNGDSAQVRRARTDTVSTYFKWATSASQAKNYTQATTYYDTLLKLSYCDASCHSQAQPADATAYYNLAEQQLALQQYTTAVNAYNVLTTDFPNAPEVKQSHNDNAKALWGLGQQQLTTTCSDAVKTYRQLISQFGDTAQGQQANTALQQPVTVEGHFTTTIPGPPAHPAVSLVQGMYFGITDSQFSQLIDGAPHTAVQSNGNFTFNSVPQGTYTLVWSYDGEFNYAYGHNQDQLLYQANLGPLCTYNYGNIQQTISPPA